METDEICTDLVRFDRVLKNW